MLNIAKQELLFFSKCSFIKASAENTSLTTHSVDFITVAQAFHWFDRHNFKIECKRILKKSGKVVLVWHRGDENDPCTIEKICIIKKLCPDFKGVAGGSEENPNAYADFFDNGFCDFQAFKNDLTLNEANFIGKSLSGSFAPNENDENYNQYVNEI